MNECVLALINHGGHKFGAADFQLLRAAERPVLTGTEERPAVSNSQVVPVPAPTPHHRLIGINWQVVEEGGSKGNRGWGEGEEL